MLIAALALVALGLFAGAAGMRRLGRFVGGLPGPWRPGAAGGALLSCLGGLALAARGALLESALMFALCVGLAVLARRRAASGAPKAAAGPGFAEAAGGMSEAEARRTLGVSAGAGRVEIEAAYRRLMARVHPDVGGADGLAAQVNRARETLLRGAA